MDVSLKKLDLSILELPKESLVDQRLIAFFRANGEGAEDIAERLQIPLVKVNYILDSKETTSLVFRIQRALFKTPQERYNALAVIAMEKLAAIMMHSEDDRLVSANAINFMDRAWGKPTQTLLQGNFSLPDSPEAIDESLKRVEERLARLEDQRQKLDKGQILEGELVS